MDGNNDFDLIMRSIVSGFTGDLTFDILTENNFWKRGRRKLPGV